MTNESISVWDSLEIRVPWAHEIVSSILTTLTYCGEADR